MGRRVLRGLGGDQLTAGEKLLAMMDHAMVGLLQTEASGGGVEGFLEGGGVGEALLGGLGAGWGLRSECRYCKTIYLGPSSC